VKATAKPAQKAAAKPAAAPSPVAKPVVASKPLAAPVAKAAPAPVAKPVVPVARPSQAPVTAQRAMPANGAKPADARLTAPAAPASSTDTLDSNGKKQITSRHGFKTNELIVYPAHGVGKIIGIEEQEIAGISLELFVIEFDKDKMTLRVPTSKLASVGMRKLAEDGVLKKAMDTLKGKARIKRTMWSRRAQEYEAKINSGDLVSIAEVVRDLYRSDAQPEQSYSERQLYEAALDRMSREFAAVDRSDERGAMQRITEMLAKSARGRRAAEADEASDGAEAGAVKAA
jgi:CarD family transcriptional regulator